MADSDSCGLRESPCWPCSPWKPLLSVLAQATPSSVPGQARQGAPAGALHVPGTRAALQTEGTAGSVAHEGGDQTGLGGSCVWRNSQRHFVLVQASCSDFPKADDGLPVAPLPRLRHPPSPVFLQGPLLATENEN